MLTIALAKDLTTGTNASTGSLGPLHILSDRSIIFSSLELVGVCDRDMIDKKVRSRALVRTSE